MCVPVREMGQRNRALFVIANVALATGLLLWNFREYVWPSNTVARAGVEAACGFLLGLSIAINLRMVWMSRRAGKA